MVRIERVVPESPADKCGIRSGDCLISVNGHDIRDVLDYRFYIVDRKCRFELSRQDQLFSAVLFKKEYEDPGLCFGSALMDDKQSCVNHCVFCFIDQLPAGMRETLYFKDDDSRLSFLHGNYITLTNLTDSDIDRIIDMHISPMNISVHTTDPMLRVKMMRCKRAGEVLAYLPRLAGAGIKLCCQIVLCRDINDGDALRKTMRDLFDLGDALDSVSIVPAGLTRHRENLYRLREFDKDTAADVIDTVERFADSCFAQTGRRIFFCSDEWYLKAERPLHDGDYYEGYSQLQDGVGMITSFHEDYFDTVNVNQTVPTDVPRTVSLCTGVAAFPLISSLADDMMARHPGLTVHVYRIVNRFFGESITVAGLLTGQDIATQLSGLPLGDTLYIPGTALKADEDVFLDDITVSELAATLKTRVIPMPDDGTLFEDYILNPPEN